MYSSSAYSCAAPLDPSAQEIRLLEFLRPPDELEPGVSITSTIHCRLHHVSLTAHECPAYVAVSYTSGSAPAVKEIVVNGVRVLVKESLWTVLQHLRLRGGQRTLFWIDALCIDRGNVAERNQQVGLTRQIYGKASKTIIWLGPASDDSDLAADYIQRKSYRSLLRRRGGLPTIWTRAEGKAISALCERRYWQRTWAVQEIMVSEKVEVRCGERSFEWRCLDQVRQKLRRVERMGRMEHHPYAAAVLGSFAMRICEQKAAWRGLPVENRAVSLRLLLELCQELECADPRDKVYSLLGLTTPSGFIGPHTLVADYTKSVEELYVDTLRAIIWSEEFESVQHKEDFIILLQRSLKLQPSDSVIRQETRNVLEAHDCTDILGPSENMSYITLMNQLVVWSIPGLGHNGDESDYCAPDASGVEELCSRYDQLLGCLHAKWQELSQETQLATVMFQDTGAQEEVVDQQIQHFQLVLAKIDQLESDLQKVHKMGSIIKRFRARVESLDGRS